MFNFINIYSFIPVSGCLGRTPVYCFAQGPIMLLRPGLAGKYQWREFPVVITGKYRPGKYSKF
jgi:hypothetical protein